MIYAFFQSWQIFLAHKRLILPMYFLNLLVAIFGMIPLILTVNAFADQSMLPQQLSAGFESTLFVTDFAHNQEIAFNSSLIWMVLCAGLSILAQVFASGGLLGTLYYGKGYDTQTFWSEAGRWFLPFFRLLLWVIPLFIIALAPVVVIQLIADSLLGSNPREPIEFKLNLLMASVTVISLFMAVRVFDYARIDLVNGQYRKTRVAIWNGIRFVTTKAPKVALLGAVYAIPGTIFLVGHMNFRVLIDMGWLLFISGQLYIVVRLMLRLGWYGAELCFYQTIYPAPREVGPEEDDLMPVLKDNQFETEA